MSETANLRDVLPTAAASLGVPLLPKWRSFQQEWGIPDTTKICVVLVDALGYELLRDRSGHAPYLAGLLRHGHKLQCDFPSTTATSLGSFGTGVAPGAHGIMGYLVRDPASDRLFNELSWNCDVDPAEWQSETTVFEHSARHGVRSVQIGPAKFANSGMTIASFRGAQFIAAEQLEDRVHAAARALRKPEPTLAYLYWGDLDTVGHQAGCESLAWGDELTAVDSAIRLLERLIPADAVVVVTADHGMVDIPETHRFDVAHTPALAQDVRYVGGEPRAPMAYCLPEHTEAVAQRWRDFLGSKAEVATRAEAISRGWYGPVKPEVEGRIGNVIANMLGDYSVHDSRFQGTSWHTMIGMHGSMSSAETDIPLMTIVGERFKNPQ